MIDINSVLQIAKQCGVVTNDDELTPQLIQFAQAISANNPNTDFNVVVYIQMPKYLIDRFPELFSAEDDGFGNEVYKLAYPSIENVYMFFTKSGYVLSIHDEEYDTSTTSELLVGMVSVYMIKHFISLLTQNLSIEDMQQVTLLAYPHGQPTENKE